MGGALREFQKQLRDVVAGRRDGVAEEIGQVGAELGALNTIDDLHQAQALMVASAEKVATLRREDTHIESVGAIVQSIGDAVGMLEQAGMAELTDVEREQLNVLVEEQGKTELGMFVQVLKLRAIRESAELALQGNPEVVRDTSPISALLALEQIAADLAEAGFEAVVNAETNTFEVQEKVEFVGLVASHVVRGMIGVEDGRFALTSLDELAHSVVRNEHLTEAQLKLAKQRVSHSKTMYLSNLFIWSKGDDQANLGEVLSKPRRSRPDFPWDDINSQVKERFGYLTVGAFARDVMNRFASWDSAKPEGYIWFHSVAEEWPIDAPEAMEQAVVDGMEFSTHYRWAGSQMQLSPEGWEIFYKALEARTGSDQEKAFSEYLIEAREVKKHPKLIPDEASNAHVRRFLRLPEVRERIEQYLVHAGYGPNVEKAQQAFFAQLDDGKQQPAETIEQWFAVNSVGRDGLHAEIDKYESKQKAELFVRKMLTTNPLNWPNELRNIGDQLCGYRLLSVLLESAWNEGNHQSLLANLLPKTHLILNPPNTHRAVIAHWLE